eukprot:gene2482-2823_t
MNDYIREDKTEPLQMRSNLLVGGKFDSIEQIVDEDTHSYATMARATTTYNYSSRRFNPAKKSTHKDTQQFNKIYTDRLEKLRPILHAKVENKFPSTSINKILNLKPNEECILIGTLYKEMSLKPNILKAYAQDLVGDKSLAHHYLTGLNVAIRGKGLASAEFEIHEIIPAGYPPQPYIKTIESLEDDVFVCIASGLSIGHPNTILSTSLLMEYLTGNLGSPLDQKLASRISRLIIAGNSVHKEVAVQESFVKYMSKQEILAKQKKQAIPIKEFDSFLTELCQSIPVDIIPGETDPTNLSLPQLPLNFCLFPFSVQNTNFNPVTNPYESEMGGRIFLGTSGQNIENAAKYIDVDDKLKLMEHLLTWRHLAPTAPDTLSCDPLDEDPFILEQCPHVFFTGNCDKFETKLIDGENGELVRLILVPRFADTNTVVLVNLKTLDAIPFQFDTTTFFPNSPMNE